MFRRTRQQPRPALARPDGRQPTGNTGKLKAVTIAPEGPIDEVVETNPLDYLHFLLRNLFQDSIMAPLRGAPLAVLDVGCGTGRWAAEIGEQFPDANVIGVDTDSTLLGTTTTMPENFSFTQADILTGLPFPEQGFDYVHQRMLMFDMPQAAWPRVVSELARVTSQGGWVELVEGSMMSGGPAMRQMSDWMMAYYARQGINPDYATQLDTMLESAHLTAVQQRTFDVPVGEIHGCMGEWAAQILWTRVQSIRSGMIAQSIATAMDFDSAAAAMRQEWENADIPCTWPMHYAFGQR